MVAARTLAAAAHLSLGEFFSLYPPRIYLIAWVPRLVFILSFYALLAQFLGGPSYLAYVVIGAIAQSTYLGALGFTVASITWEQGTGTVPLLVASPGSPILVFIGRNLAMLGNGVVSGALTLAFATAILGLDLTPAQVLEAVAVLVLMTVSLYCLGLLLGSFVLRFPYYRNNVSNLTVIALTFLTGTFVPLDAIPEWLRPVSEVLPGTHGLRLLRHITLGASDPGVWFQLTAEAAVALVLLLAARASFAYFLRRARSAGTLDFH
jgi:ABC-2 type transport system permease protein